MKTKTVTEIVSAILILLFAYTAFSKLLDIDQFEGQMRNQPLPGWLNEGLIVAVPSAELLSAGLLLFPATRFAGLWLSALLMLAFTGYILLIIARVFDRIPCSCGGVLRTMGWRLHLVFNIAFLLINLIALWLNLEERSAVRK